MLTEMFTRSGIVCLDCKGQIGKPIIPVLAKFRGFIDGTARLYMIKPSANANDYTPVELKTFSACVTDAFKKGIVHSKAMSRLLLLTEVNLASGKVGAFQFVDATVVDGMNDLKLRLDVDRIVEISV